MKQILKLKMLLVAVSIISSFFVPSIVVGRSTVAAAGEACPSSASTDSQVTNQQNCKKKFIKDCKEKKFDAAFCDSLTVAQINQCANDKQTGLKKACLEKVQAEVKAAEDAKKESKDESSKTTIGSEMDKNDCKGSIEPKDCEIVNIIVTITNVLAGIAGTVIVAMIILGGIQYSMAGSEAAKVQAAKQKIMNALLALLLLIFGFSIVQWLVPGGLI